MGPDPSTLAPAGRVLPLLLGAMLAEPLAALMLLHPAAAGPGWYGRPPLLVATHLVTLGALALAVVGATWQILPVITTRAWSPRLVGPVNLLLLAILPFVVGLFAPGSLAAIASAPLLLGLALRAGAVIVEALRPGPRPALRAWVVAAEIAGLAGLVLAFLLLANRVGYPLSLPTTDGGRALLLGDPMGGVSWHVALLLGGWIGGWIVAAGSLLLPMFAVGGEPRPWTMALVALPWFGGLATGTPALFGVGAMLAAGILLRALIRGLRRGPSLTQAGLGLVGLGLAGAALALGPALGIAIPGDALVVALLGLFALPVLRGVSQRIAPFLAWTHLLGGARGAPTVAELFPTRLAGVQAAVSLVGAGILVAARAGVALPGLAEPGFTRLGAVLLLVGALLHLGVLGTVLGRLLRAHLRLSALPGLESR